ncbi:MAG: hypothetical protein TR69_WS6001001239 [candidate division WS6 bacterium OLB20]|uniref:Uncharacterized protein n=1 Tax=candidate division WS6 bacterium OLB20 TaxID=1617426 RepID=A0A136LX63_9BACT|nr:MAG: hypothetical protein TR69_WS6001001239 [candidate division WS6 bacterium OLB20]
MFLFAFCPNIRTMQQITNRIQKLIDRLRLSGVGSRATLHGTHSSLKVTLDAFWPGSTSRHDLVLHVYGCEYWLTGSREITV